MENETDKLPLPELTEEQRHNLEQKWSTMPISNGYMFHLVMKHKEPCKGVLERILGIKIKELNIIPEKHVEISVSTRGIRLDISATDEDGTVYDIEMQTSDEHDTVMRARYYTSMLDADALEKSVPYKKLRGTIIIFICMFDPFDRNFSKYTFRNFCEEDKTLELKDKCTKIFLNTKGIRTDISEDLANLLDYFAGETPRDELTKQINEQVETNRKDNGSMTNYIRLEQERMALEDKAEARGEAKGRREGEAKGRAEGELIGMLRMACKLVKEGTYTVQKAATELSMSVEEFMQKAQAVAAL